MIKKRFRTYLYMVSKITDFIYMRFCPLKQRIFSLILIVWLANIHLP